MSSRTVVGVVAVVAMALGGACGGGDGEDGAGGAEVEFDTAPIVDVDPCAVLTGRDAERLVGAEVERTAGSALGRAVGCSYAAAHGPSGDAATGAELFIEPRDEATTADVLSAVGTEVDEAAALEGDVQPVTVGEGGFLMRTETDVEVRYVVRSVLVTLKVRPEDEVDEELVADVVEFANETAEPVKKAVDEAPFDGAGSAVESTANVYLALTKPDDAGDGTPPPVLGLDDADVGDEVRFEVTGSINCCSGTPNGNADGQAGSTTITGANGIGGFAADRQLPLVGVFLDDDEPDFDPEPGDAQSGGASRVEAELGAPFLIGDGLDEGGEPLVVEVPDGATRLVLGFVDGVGFTGSPGAYTDNRGSLRVALVT